MKETSRDLWSRTKVPLAQGKRKSKELVDLSADLISNLSIRVQKTLHHGRDRQEHPFDPRESDGFSFISRFCLPLSLFDKASPVHESEAIDETGVDL